MHVELEISSGSNKEKKGKENPPTIHDETRHI
jgi:hypothetical protein